MADPPLVTVLVTTYNSNPEYLNLTIESAINQDYPNLEVLVIDDGSMPKVSNTVELINHHKVRYEYMQHMGVPHGLNLGMKEAKGKYVALLDHDDILSENSISDRVEILKQGNCGLVYGDIEHIDWKGDRYSSNSYIDYSSVDDFISAILTNVVPPLKHSGIMFDRDVVLGIGNYDVNLAAAYDTDLCIRIAKKAGISHIPQIVVSYRTHKKNLTLDLTYRKHSLKYNLMLVDKYIPKRKGRRTLTKGKVALVNYAKLKLADKKKFFQKHQWIFRLFKLK